jgi:hypothetical protein
MKVVEALAFRVMRTALKIFFQQKPKLVLAFACLLTLGWLALLIWLSAGIIELI